MRVDNENIAHKNTWWMTNWSYQAEQSVQVNRNGKCLLQRYQDDSSNSDNQLVLGALVGFYGSGDFFK